MVGKYQEHHTTVLAGLKGIHQIPVELRSLLGRRTCGILAPGRARLNTMKE